MTRSSRSRGSGADATGTLVAFALFTVSIDFSIATISNDNLQDLKTGQLVGASPWKQQVALIVGVVAGSLVIPLVLDLLNRAYGFPGDPNRASINTPRYTKAASQEANMHWTRSLVPLRIDALRSVERPRISAGVFTAETYARLAASQGRRGTPHRTSA